MMNTNRKIKSAFAALVIISGLLCLFSINSCTKDYYELYEMDNGQGLSDYIKIEDWETVVPIAYGEMTLSQLLSSFGEQNLIGEYTNPGSDENLMYLSFTQDVRSQAVDQFIDINNEVYNNSIYGDALVGSPLTAKKTFNFNLISFDRPRAITKIKIKSGNLKVDISSNFTSPGTIKFTPHIRTVDSDFTPWITRTYNMDGSGSWSTSDVINLTDNYVFTGNSPGLDSTFFIIDGELTVNGAGPFNAGDVITITTTLDNIEYSALFGYFGNDTLINFEPDKIPIDLISENDPWHFADPRISVEINNSMGFPIHIKAQDVFVECLNLTPNNQQLFFGGNDTFNIDVPYSKTFGNDTLYNKSLTNDIDPIMGTPGFVYVMNNDPKKMEYTSFAESNPQKVVNINQWLADTSKVDMKILLDLPLYGLTKDWTINDTMELGFGGDSATEELANFVEEIVLRLNFTNGLPLDLKVQGIMLDSLGNAIDSLFQAGEEIIAPSASIIKDTRVAEPNAFTVETPTQKVTDIVIKDNQIDNFFNTKSIIFRISSTSKDADINRYIRIYSFNMIDIKLAGKVKLSGTTHFRDL